MFSIPEIFGIGSNQHSSFSETFSVFQNLIMNFQTITKQIRILRKVFETRDHSINCKNFAHESIFLHQN